ncbi:hypothetical protein CC79DRAFT_865874 [Sarocladium strictum]
MTVSCSSGYFLSRIVLHDLEILQGRPRSLVGLVFVSETPSWCCPMHRFASMCTKEKLSRSEMTSLSPVDDATVEARWAVGAVCGIVKLYEGLEGLESGRFPPGTIRLINQLGDVGGCASPHDPFGTPGLALGLAGRISCVLGPGIRGFAFRPSLPIHSSHIFSPVMSS